MTLNVVDKLAVYIWYRKWVVKIDVRTLGLDNMVRNSFSRKIISHNIIV